MTLTLELDMLTRISTGHSVESTNSCVKIGCKKSRVSLITCPFSINLYRIQVRSLPIFNKLAPNSTLNSQIFMNSESRLFRASDWWLLSRYQGQQSRFNDRAFNWFDRRQWNHSFPAASINVRTSAILYNLCDCYKMKRHLFQEWSIWYFAWVWYGQFGSLLTNYENKWLREFVVIVNGYRM